MPNDTETEFDTAWTDYPVCPHCGVEDQDWWEHRDLKNDGDEITVTCGDCEKDHTITMAVEYTFYTEKRQESLTKELAAAEKNLGFFQEKLDGLEEDSDYEQMYTFDRNSAQFKVTELKNERTRLQKSGQWEEPEPEAEPEEASDAG